MSQKEHPFSKHFLWGAATAAHQVEGGNHNQWSVWELENARSLAAQAPHKDSYVPVWDDIKEEATNPDNYISGSLADHYHHYKDDFALLEKLHMNAYRFSIEWSRIEPKRGQWDASEVDHYRAYINELKRRGIEPIVTLFHFTLPVWFAEMGGFEKRANVAHFVQFAERIVRELGRDIRYIITINEPDVYLHESYVAQHWPPQKTGAWNVWRVANNLARAHNLAAKAIHQIGRQYKVSIAKNSNNFYPGDNAWLSRLSARWMQYWQDDYFIRKVIKHCDFLGVNYYFSNRVYGYRIHNPDQKLSDLGWDLAPGDIEYVLLRLHDTYKKPILITENGIADRDDEFRKWWIAQTLAGMQRAMNEGVPLLGYLHWSLFDNFEWGYGKWPRFGLAAVDYETGKRTLRPSALWFGGIIRKLRGL